MHQHTPSISILLTCYFITALSCTNPVKKASNPAAGASPVIATTTPSPTAVVNNNAHAADSALVLQHWLDSLNRIIKKGLPTHLYGWDHYELVERLSIRYINACGRLGDYYTARDKNGHIPGLEPAMRYYKRVIYLSNGTDADLCDDNAFIERNRVCYRVAQLCNEGLLDAQKLGSIYVGFYVNPARLNLHNTFNGMLTDSISASIRFCPGNARFSPDAQAVLKRIALLIQNQPRKIKVVGGVANRSLDQQISWEQSNAVIEYFVDSFHISRQRFIQNYGGDGPQHEVQIIFARDGEDGPCNVPPPHPNFNARSLK